MAPTRCSAPHGSGPQAAAHSSGSAAGFEPQPHSGHPSPRFVVQPGCRHDICQPTGSEQDSVCSGNGWQWGPGTSVSGMTTVHTSCTMFCQPASSSMAASITHTCFPVGRPGAPCYLLPVREPMKHSPWESGWSGLGWGSSQGKHLLNVPLGRSHHPSRSPSATA